MPWEIDHALFTADRLKQGLYNISSNDVIYIDSALNLSSQVINWDSSKLPKEFFVEKYNLFLKTLSNKVINNSFVYDGNDIYGHLDLQKTAKQENVDYYINICPDIDFSPSLLFYMIESAKQISTKYFVLTSQIFRCWDESWDVLVNQNFMKYRCNETINVDIHDIRHQSQQFNDVSIIDINEFKFAGWFDLYNKSFFENLCPYLDEWHGYGPWDYYAINICNFAKKLGVDVRQYVIKNEVIYFYDNGILSDTERGYNGDGLFKSTYKKFLCEQITKTQQTNNIYKSINRYMNDWANRASKEGIIR